MTDRTERLFDGLSGVFLVIGAGALPLAMANGWLEISSATGCLIAGVCGLIAGFLRGHVYGPRYYPIFIGGMFLAAIGGFMLCYYCASELNLVAVPKVVYLIALLLATAIGVAPGVLLGRVAKKIQDAIYPPSEAELARHRQIDRRRTEASEYYRAQPSGATVKEKLEYRFTVMVLFVLAIIPPVGFLASLLVFSRSGSVYGRRVASIGMGLSVAILVVYGMIYLWLNSLDPNVRMAKRDNAAPFGGVPANNNAPAPVQPINFATLADKMDVSGPKEQLAVMQQLIRMDPKKASAEEVKIAAKTMKKLAFDKNAGLVIRQNAVKAMVVWGGSYSVPQLMELIKRDGALNDCCFQSLASLNDPRALDAVAEFYMTDDRGGHLAEYCLQAYGEAAEDAVLKYFPPKDGLRLRNSIDFLKKNGTSKSLAALEKVGKQRLYKEDAAAAIAVIKVREKEKSKAKQAK